VGRFNLVGLPYLEAGVSVPAALEGRPGTYYVYLYLDRAAPIVGGREIYGFPKKEAEITFVEEKGRVGATVTRRGSPLVRASLELGDPLPIQASAGPGIAYNLKLIPSVVSDAPPDVLQLTACSVESTLKELLGGVAHLELLSGPEDLLAEIPVLKIVGATFSVADMVLGAGTVAHDYLAQR